MKTLCLSVFLLFSLNSIGQCTQTQLPNAPSNLVVTENRPHTDPHLNWETIPTACDYVVNAKIVEKRGNGYTEQQAAGYPIIIVNNLNYTQQEFYDTWALQLANSYKGITTLKYEIYSRNNMGNSNTISGGYIKIR
jgi:hypothetical protein